MDNLRQDNSGFDPRVVEQLNHIAETASPVHSGRGRGRGQRGNNYRHRPSTDKISYDHHATQAQAWNSMKNPNQPNPDSFPPHESLQTRPYRPHHHSGNHDQHELYQNHSYQRHPDVQSQSHQTPFYPSPHQRQHASNQASEGQGPNRDFFERARGGAYRGGQRSYRQNQQYQPHTHHYQQNVNVNDFARPPQHSSNKLYTPGMNPYAGTAEQQRAFRHKIMSQSDFLASIASQSLQNQMTTEEAQTKEAFRKKLQAMAQYVIASSGGADFESVAEHVKLRLYGSLGSGFGIAGSDMDLLLTFPQGEGPLREVEIVSRRMLERAILDAGHGARLLTNTRVPILKVCEKPSPELLSNLRDYRLQWEQSEDCASLEPTTGAINDTPPTLSDEQRSAAIDALGQLDVDPADIPLPASPSLDHAKLEFAGDCGIQCDINFSNYVALRNTELLKTYGQCDGRVRQIGIFVKNWAKARDINTPYRGTLSSYGYIMMVLHYVMNVVNPPLIPNLQQIAKEQDRASGNTEIETIEGCDVRFIRNPQQVQDIMRSMTKNGESLGSLLRGFFWYYASPQGFHYNRDIISIRSKGGCVTKRAKGWTEAKWSDQHSHVRLRYLLAIEDPFEIDHNIGRTVGHHGIVAIRDEFRRAWSMIDTVHLDSTSKTWFWLDKGERKSAEDFMAVSEKRGDMLRQDQNFHRDKMRRMRQEAEAKEQALKQGVLQENAPTEDSYPNGTWTDANSESLPDTEPQPDFHVMKLIHDRSSQDKNREWKSRTSRRQVVEDEDHENTSSIGKAEVMAITDAGEDWENKYDPQAYMTCSKDTWGNETRGDEQEELNNIQPVIKSRVTIDWENENNVATYMTSEKDMWGSASDSKPTSTEMSMFASPDSETPLTSVTKSDPDIAPTKDETHDFAQDLENSSDLQSREEVVSQRKDHFSTIGDRMFARDRNARLRLEPHNRPLRADRKVGNHIFWDESTKTGRWLKWRDRQIQAGSWTGTMTECLRNLDEKFPYNPEMSYADLALMNAELQKNYRYSFIPYHSERQTLKNKPDRGESFVRSIHEDLKANSANEQYENKYPNHGKSTMPIVSQVLNDESIDEKHEPRPVDDSMPHHESLKATPDENILSRLVGAVQPADHPVPDDTEHDEASDFTLDQLRERRLMYFARTDFVSVSKPERHELNNHAMVFNRDSSMQKSSGVPDVSEQTPAQASHVVTESSGVEQEHKIDPSCPPPNDHQQKLLSLLNIKTKGESIAQVPLTLYPDVPNDQRPRDEDPNIMPIPRKPGFAFDPRQLEDLEKIKLGGNGCARKGEEFNIEEDYEWGGGGAMGYKSSSGMWYSGRDDVKRASSWHGGEISTIDC